MSKFQLFELKYEHDMGQFYDRLRNLPGFVLLESSDHSRGRYDIVSAIPYHTITFQPKSEQIKNIFRFIEEAVPQRQYGLTLPFQGGAIGFFSYDLACLLRGLPLQDSLFSNQLPLAEFKLYDWAIITDHHLRKVTLFVANTQPDTKDLIQDVLACWHRAGNESQSDYAVKSAFTPLIRESDYAIAFKIIQEELKRGRCYQVNYTQPYIAPIAGDPWQAYIRIRQKNPVPYAAFMQTADASILSFSPERFIKMTDKTLLASPIKGSEKRSADANEDEFLKNRLINSLKNRAENVMIVDLLRNDLGKIAKPGTVKVEKLCALESYAAVHHLVSTITAQCRDEVTALQAFESCFPCGSITGAPKLEAMKVIVEREKYSRGVYCGSIAYFSAHGDFDSNVAIRTLTALDGQLHMAAGGGIVIDSNCEDEYEECNTKIAAIIRGLL
ncbi:aminodeoxychorismate synthase component I [Legionella dresdenensis]|uniref:aminodeoxychorismate synthase n=1 Tax=Legionella dresdenensis TaxID=450200 RepID=A0ABV8CBS8_9GAMM